MGTMHGTVGFGPKDAILRCRGQDVKWDGVAPPYQSLPLSIERVGHAYLEYGSGILCELHEDRWSSWSDTTWSNEYIEVKLTRSDDKLSLNLSITFKSVLAKGVYKLYIEVSTSSKKEFWGAEVWNGFTYEGTFTITNQTATVTYIPRDSEHVTVGRSRDTVEIGDSVLLPSIYRPGDEGSPFDPPYSVSGYGNTFWTTSLDEDTKIGVEGTSYTPTGDTSLYAWAKAATVYGYVISFDLDGGTDEYNAISCGPYTSGERSRSVYLPTVSPTKKGYTFQHWKYGVRTAKAGSTVTLQFGTTTFIAIWKKNSTLRVNTGGIWQEDTETYVNVNGIWIPAEKIFVNKGGVWIEI